MKKEDLKTGMRVKYENGALGIVLADIDCIALKGGGFCHVSSFNDNFGYDYADPNGGWYLVAIWEGYTCNAQVLNFQETGKLLWKKEVKSESQKQLDNVMEKLAELQKEAEQLQETIKKEKK